MSSAPFEKAIFPTIEGMTYSLDKKEDEDLPRECHKIKRKTLGQDQKSIDWVRELVGQTQSR